MNSLPGNDLGSADTSPVLESQLLQIAEEIDSSLDKEEAVKFDTLITKRGSIINRLHAVLEPQGGIRADLLAKLAGQNRSWQDKADVVLSRIKSNIADANVLRAASRSLNNAYGPKVTTGRHIRRKG